jgi:hypothetical protein
MKDFLFSLLLLAIFVAGATYVGRVLSTQVEQKLHQVVKR